MSSSCLFAFYTATRSDLEVIVIALQHITGRGRYSSIPNRAKATTGLWEMGSQLREMLAQSIAVNWHEVEATNHLDYGLIYLQ